MPGNTSLPPRGPSIKPTTTRWAGANPGDFVTIFTLIIVGIAIALDTFNLVTLDPGIFSSAAVLAITALAIVLVARHARLKGVERSTQETSAAVRRLVELEEQRRGFFPVDPSDIPERLEGLLTGTRLWYFRGGSGRWQRKTALPTLAATRERETEYRMQILDPRVEELCERYARYRAQQRSHEVLRVGEGRALVVRDDLLACIYAAAWYRANSRVRTQVFLSTVYSPARVDLGSLGVAVTVADPKTGALFASHQSWYYASILDEFKESAETLDEILFTDASADIYPPQWNTVTGEHVERFFAGLQIRHGREIAEFTCWGRLDYERIAILAFEGRE